MHFTDCNFFSNNIKSMWLFKISEMKYDIYYLQKDLRKRDSIRGTKGKRN